jgi:hypothetical protein
LAVFALLIVVLTAAPIPAPPAWEKLLGWLPEDTETVIVTPHPFVIPDPDRKKEPEPADYRRLILTPPALVPCSVHESFLIGELRGLKAICMVEGSRRFRQPKDIGMILYEGCHILQFDLKDDAKLQTAVGMCREKAAKAITVVDVPVSVFTEERESDTWTFYICRPRPGMLVCATDRSYLTEVLRRMAGKDGKRALPADLPEWKHVDVTAGVWRIRHYRKDQAGKDPSSPLSGEDRAAVGTTFWVSTDGRTAEVRYLSDAKNAVELATDGWTAESEGLSPRIKAGPPGVVEITVALNKDETVARFLFNLLYHLGHAILV